MMIRIYSKILSQSNDRKKDGNAGTIMDKIFVDFFAF